VNDSKFIILNAFFYYILYYFFKNSYNYIISILLYLQLFPFTYGGEFIISIIFSLKSEINRYTYIKSILVNTIVPLFLSAFKFVGKINIDFCIIYIISQLFGLFIGNIIKKF